MDSPVALAPGDELQIGTRTFRFVRGPLPDGVSPATPEESSLTDPRLLRTTASLPAIDKAVFVAMSETRGRPRRSAIRWAAGLAIGALLLALTCSKLN